MKDLYVFTPHFRAISGKVRSGFSRVFSRVFTHKQVSRAWLFGDREVVTEKPGVARVVTRPRVIFVLRTQGEASWLS